MKKEEATMKKEEATTTITEATTKKTEAKEEAAAPKHIRVVYTDKRRRIIYFVSALVLLIICVFAFSYVSIQPRVPRFMLEDLYVDSLSNSSVMVKLSSTNPGHKTSLYYSKMSLHVRVLEDFETESVFLESTLQEPRRFTTWTAVVSNNTDNVKPTGAFLVRHGVAYGDIIADIMIQWKSGIFWSPKFALRVRCPVLLRLEDLSSAITEPMSTCSHHLDF